jgi:hypothetical protein
LILELELAAFFDFIGLNSGPECSARTLVRDDTFVIFFKVSMDLFRSGDALFLGGEDCLRLLTGYD